MYIFNYFFSVLPNLQRGEEVQGHRHLRGLRGVLEAVRQDGERDHDAGGAGAHTPLLGGEAGERGGTDR